MLLKASTARNRSFLLVQSADHLTGLTGATPTVTLSKDAGAFAAAGGTVTEIANGWYKIALTTTDTNTKGDLSYHVTAASGDPSDFADQVVTDLPGDSVASVTGAVASVTAGVTVTTNNDKTGYSLTQTFPTNFSSLAITAGGNVTVGTNSDKTGYSLTVTPPTSAQIATAVWQDTTAGDFTVASSIGKSLFTSGNAPGAASGLALVGSNMGTVSSVTGAVGSVTGAVGSVTAAVLISAGTGAGQLDFTSGVVKANLAQILGTALTETAGQIAAAFKKFFNIATPASTMDHLTLIDTVTTATTTTTATNLTNAPTAGDFTAAMKTSLNAATPASVTGAVGSVTGAVGSVTGSVGGNVVGSVGSVAGAVASVTGNVGGNVVGSVASVTAGVTLAAGAIDAASLATAGRQAIADGVLDRDMSVGTDSGSSTVRTARQALRVLRNKVDIPGGTVYKEDDATSSWTFATTTAAGNPVTSVDPTGP